MIRLLLMDNYLLFREALALQLSVAPKVGPIYEADELKDALSILRTERPHIVLSEITVPSHSIHDMVASLRAVDSKCRIVFLTGHDVDAYVEEALSMDIQGYILKGVGYKTLLEGIRIVAEGGRYFSESIRKRVSYNNGRIALTRPRSDAIAALSSRERELLRHLSTGASLKQAAAIMNISYKTSDNQKASLMRKLDIHDRVELARFAIREGLVSPA